LKIIHDVGGFLQVDQDGNPMCNCVVCKCGCQVRFKAHERLKISRTLALDAHGVATVEEQSTAGLFYNLIQDHVQNCSIEAMQQSGTYAQQAVNDG
jgi:hypothetical protein